MTNVVISEIAQRDLDDIWLHIASDSPLNADRFIDRLVDVVTDTLGTAPLAGREREEFAEGLRSFPFEKYVVFYRVASSNVEIVRIVHGARDLGAIFGA